MGNDPAAVIFGVLVALLGFALMLVGIGTFGLQVFAFLVDGNWHPCSVRDALAFLLARQYPWLDYPGTMLGIHKILSWLPFPITSVAVAIMIMLFGAAIRDAR